MGVERSDAGLTQRSVEGWGWRGVEDGMGGRAGGEVVNVGDLMLVTGSGLEVGDP